MVHPLWPAPATRDLCPNDFRIFHVHSTEPANLTRPSPPAWLGGERIAGDQPAVGGYLELGLVQPAQKLFERFLKLGGELRPFPHRDMQVHLAGCWWL